MIIKLVLSAEKSERIGMDGVGGGWRRWDEVNRRILRTISRKGFQTKEVHARD